MKAVNLEGPPRAGRREAVKDTSLVQFKKSIRCNAEVWGIFGWDIPHGCRTLDPSRGQDGMELGRKFLAEGEAGARSVPWPKGS